MERRSVGGKEAREKAQGEKRRERGEEGKRRQAEEAERKGVDESRGQALVWHDELATVTTGKVPSRSLHPRWVGWGVGLGWGRGRKWTEGPRAPG